MVHPTPLGLCMAIGRLPNQHGQWVTALTIKVYFSISRSSGGGRGGVLSLFTTHRPLTMMPLGKNDRDTRRI